MCLRFAPHLEKCMGMGRNSSRVASRRLANSNKESYRLFILSIVNDLCSHQINAEKRDMKRKMTTMMNGLSLERKILDVGEI